MGSKATPVASGGGPAVGLADTLTQYLSSLFGGMPGFQQNAADNMGRADPIGKTDGIFGNIWDILSPGGGNVGGALKAMIQQNTKDEVGASRARFTQSGGVSRGTPAAVAEGTIRAREGPALTSAIGGLQMNAIQSLLPIISALAGKGIAQREESTVFQPNTWLSVLQALGGAAQGAGALASGLKAKG